MRSKYYHGTTTALHINNIILPPIYTSTLREHWRVTNLNKVFVTNSKMSATKFAKKASVRYGGSPVIYEVTPVNLDHRINNEFVCDNAHINSSIVLNS